MWVVWLSLLSWIWRKPMQGKTTESIIARDFRQRIMFGFSLTLLLIAIVLNPFKETPEFFFGSGLNELLQTDLMVIHPPIIFLAYSFCIFHDFHCQLPGSGRCMGIIGLWRSLGLSDIRLGRLFVPALSYLGWL